MLSPIQYLLIGLVLLLTIAAIQAFHNKLFYRIVVVSGLVLALTLILYPPLTARLAMLLDVGRGVDLVFYLLFLVILFVVVVIYRKLLKIEETLTKLARNNAIQNAITPE